MVGMESLAFDTEGKNTIAQVELKNEVRTPAGAASPEKEGVCAEL